MQNDYQTKRFFKINNVQLLLVHRPWSIVHSQSSIVNVQSSMFNGQWSINKVLSSIVYGLSSMVYHLSSIVYCLSSIVYRLWTMDYRQGSIVYRLKALLFFLFIILSFNSFSQPYTSYFTGDTSDVTTTTSFGTCLMGGATEDDNAMKWFLNKSGGGDIVVIRATGSNGYNTYLYSQLGISVNSVETIVIPSVAAANDPYVRKQLRNAEAVFLAGGNQANYINFWKNTAVDSALNYLINVKQCPIGGTSAGMMVQGQNYYSALGSSVTSAQVLTNPFNTNITLGSNNFLFNKYLKRTITDTHFDNPDRRGRLTGFLARLVKDSLAPQLAIACDEYTAVCIDEFGMAKVFGGFPTHDDNAYFVATNCDVNANIPEQCVPNSSLTWNKGQAALKVYRIKGTPNANNSFNLNDFKTATGGVWQHWYVNSGVFTVDSNNIQPTFCPTVLSLKDEKNINNIIQNKIEEVVFYPNPFVNNINFKLNKNIAQVNIYNSLGMLLQNSKYQFQEGNQSIQLSQSNDKIYIVEVVFRNNKKEFRKLIKL